MNSLDKHVHYVLLCFWRWELVMFFYVLNDFFFLASVASLVKLARWYRLAMKSSFSYLSKHILKY